MRMIGLRILVRGVYVAVWAVLWWWMLRFSGEVVMGWGSRDGDVGVVVPVVRAVVVVGFFFCFLCWTLDEGRQVLGGVKETASDGAW